MPALSTAGRDVRLPDGSKIRIICHKVAVQVTALEHVVDMCIKSLLPEQNKLCMPSHMSFVYHYYHSILSFEAQINAFFLIS